MADTTGDASYNTLKISGGTFDYTVLAGRVWTGDAAYNTLEISGGTFTDFVVGGWATHPTTSNLINHNVITIRGNADLKDELFGGYQNCYDDPCTRALDLYTGNTLNLQTQLNNVTRFGNFQFLNFTLPAGMTPGSTMLTVTDRLTNGGSLYGSVIYGGPTTALDVRTPSNLSDGTYTLIRTGANQTLNDLGGGYSLYGTTFLGSGTTNRTLTLSSGRVQGDFTIHLDSGDNKNLQLTVTSYNAPNKTLAWNGNGSTTWLGYSATAPKNWLESGTSIAYLDGDTVRFNNTASAYNVTIDPAGVSPASVTFDNTGNNYTLGGGPIMGTASLTKTGTGRLTLTDTNDYTGGTTIHAGLINFNATGNFGTGNIALNGGGLQWATGNSTDISSRLSAIGANGATFDTNGNNVTLASNLGGTGNLSKTGLGRLTLSGTNNTYSGGTTVSVGTLAGNIAANTGLTVANGATYDGTGTARTVSALNGGGNVINSHGLTVQSGNFGGIISGAGSLTKTSAGTLTLSGTNTYTGDTTVSAGSLNLAQTGSLQSAVTVRNNATFSLHGMVGNNKDVSIENGGTLNAYQSGSIAGKLKVTNADLNFYLPQGIDDGDILLSVGDTATISDSRIKLFFDGSYDLTRLGESERVTLIDTANGLTTSNNTHVTAVAGVSLNYEFTLKEENGDLLAERNSAQTLPPARTENITVTWTNGANNGLWDTNAQNWSGMDSNGDPVNTFIGGDDTTFGNTGAGTVTVAPAGVAPKTVNVGSSQGYTFTGGSIEADTLTKTGAGTLILTGDNTYSGGTTVSTGTLQIGNGGTTGSVTGDIANNANVTFNRSNDLTYGNVISGNGTLTKTGAGTLTLSGANTHSGATTVNAGTLNLTGSLANSAVNVSNTAALTLSGTARKSVSLASGATLNAYSGGNIGGDLDAAGANLNFYLPSTFAANGTLLNVGGNASIGGSTVRVGILGGSSPLQAGDSVTLLNTASLTGSPANGTANAAGLQGVSLLYDFTLSTDANRLLATVKGSDGGSDEGGSGGGDEGGGDNGGADGGDSGGGGGDNGGGDSGVQLNPRTKALAEGFLAGTAFLNQGTDFVTDRGLAAAQKANSAQSGASSFVALGGGSLRHETGSHVDVDGYTLVAGLALTRTMSAGEFTLGAFIEHGEGDYDSANSFANAASVHGKGDADYTGGGLLTHLKFNETQRGHFYTEASARLGKVDLDFNTRDLIDAFVRRAAYDSSSRYAGVHAGLGYVLKLNANSTLKLYGQFLWSRQGSDTVRLTTGEPVKFQAVDSQRARLGVKWSRAVNQSGQFYLGAAWEHEFDGEAQASIHGYRLDMPKLTGDTGMLEAGFSLTPSPTKPLTLDFGIQGYSGKREGVTGSFRVNYWF
jgi:autotransporter-associated beta strand protein